MNPTEQYIADRKLQVCHNVVDGGLQISTKLFTRDLIRTNYIKNFTWLGRPIMQYPTDLMVIQELIWQIKPDAIIETGIAFGGSSVFFASMMNLTGRDGFVFAVDNELRPHNRAEIDRHPMRDRIWIFDGSSTEQAVVDQIGDLVHYGQRAMVVLDSNHTEAHVLEELRLYEKFVSVGSYLIVCDTTIEDWAEEFPDNRPWGRGNSPMTAVERFLRDRNDFEIDLEIEQRAVLTGCRNGYLRRIR